MATTQDEATRWWFLLSNALFLAPAGWLLYRAIAFGLYDRILHAYLAVFVGVASFLYHLCDEQDAPGDDGVEHVCIISFQRLYFIDFTLSIVTLMNALTYAPPKRHYWIRDLGIVTAFLFPPFISQQDRNMYIFTGVLAFLVILARWILRALRPDAVCCQCPLVNDTGTVWWFPFEGDWWFLFVSLVLALGGLICFILDDQYFYWYLHPTWHALEALALLFWFIWMDSLPDEPDPLAFSLAYAVIDQSDMDVKTIKRASRVKATV